MTSDDQNPRGPGRVYETDPAKVAFDDTPEHISLAGTDVVPIPQRDSDATAPKPTAPEPKPAAAPEPKPAAAEQPAAAKPPTPKPAAAEPPSRYPHPAGPPAPPRPTTAQAPAGQAPAAAPPKPVVAQPPPAPKPAATEPARPAASTQAPTRAPEPAPQPKPAAPSESAVAARPRAWRDANDPYAVQVVDYLLAVRRRLAWLVVIPIVVGLVAGGILLSQPRQLRARATVTLPVATAANKSPSTGEVAQAVSDFQEVIVSDTVLAKVARDTGVPKNTIKAHLVTRHLGSSNLVNVSFTSTKRDRATKVLLSAAHTGVERLFEPAVVAANTAVTASERDLADLQAQIANFGPAHGLSTTPQEAYRAKQQELAQPHSDADRAQIQADATRLGALVSEYQRLQARVATLTAVANSAAARQGDAKVRLEASKSSATVDLIGVRRLPRLRPVVTGVGTAVAAALLLVLALIVLLEVFDPENRAPIPAAPQRSAPQPAASQDRPQPPAQPRGKSRRRNKGRTR